MPGGGETLQIARCFYPPQLFPCLAQADTANQHHCISGLALLISELEDQKLMAESPTVVAVCRLSDRAKLRGWQGDRQVGGTLCNVMCMGWKTGSKESSSRKGPRSWQRTLQVQPCVQPETLVTPTPHIGTMTDEQS